MALGQRGELLQQAAQPGESVAVGVLEERQTAIVEAGARVLLNFNHFFRQASELLPAGNLSVAISRQLLDESGALLSGTREELSPASQDRVTVSAGGEAQQHFVSTSGAVLNDSGVYTVEVCSQSSTSQEECREANVTLFVLDRELMSPFSYTSYLNRLSPVGPFTVTCNNIENSLQSVLTVVCSSDTGLVADLSCSIDNAISQDCGTFQYYFVNKDETLCPGDEEGFFTIDLTTIAPGSHTLNVTATSDNGEQATAGTLNFTVPQRTGIARCRLSQCLRPANSLI